MDGACKPHSFKENVETKRICIIKIRKRLLKFVRTHNEGGGLRKFDIYRTYRNYRRK